MGEIKKKKMETSKGIVIAILVIFTISMAAAYTLPVLFEHVGEISLKIFQSTATLTGSVLIGYYGKAGFENYDKNKKLLKFEESDGGSDVEDGAGAEGGNG